VAGASRMCPHLIGADDPEHVRLLTGKGLTYDICCPACDRSLTAGDPSELLVVCEGCVDRAHENDWYTLLAWRGEP
jgi:hypothetical protein